MIYQHFNNLSPLFFGFIICFLISCFVSDAELSALEAKENKKLIRKDVSLEFEFNKYNNVFIISEWMPVGYYLEFKSIFFSTFDKYKNFYPITNYLELDSCLNKNEGPFSLSNLLYCRPKSLIIIKKNNFQSLKKNYPTFEFEYIDSSRVNYLVRKLQTY